MSAKRKIDGVEPSAKRLKMAEAKSNTEELVGKYFNAEEFKGLSKLVLLKKIEEKTQGWFLTDQNKVGDESFVNRTCKSNFSGIEDFSEEYFQTLQLAELRQEYNRVAIELALSQCEHGFSEFDRLLLLGSVAISRAYGPFYLAWSRSVSDKPINEWMDKNGKPEPDSDLASPYTALVLKDDKLSCMSYGDFYKAELQPVIEALDDLQKKLSECESSDPGFIPYLKQYRDTLVESDISKLEDLNKELDRKWMDIDYWIDFVHDIETGYGDPMRVKAIPDFSIRFKDSEFAEANATMVTIKQLMMAYFRGRNTEIARNGLTALGTTSSAIFYLPFQSGMSLHFRFSGQCIPNRPEVKKEKGIKIYFDAVSTADRMEQVRALVRKVFENPEEVNKCIDAVVELTYMTSSHEVGHAIYGLRSAGIDGMTGQLCTELEEPRAELTSVHTLKLLKDVNLITEKEMAHHLQCFMLSDLRRYEQWEAKSTYPYTISAINMYKTYFKHGYVSFNDDKTKLRVDPSKAYAVLTELSALFEKILMLEDNNDFKGLSNIHKEMKEPDSEICQWLVKQLFTS